MGMILSTPLEPEDATTTVDMASSTPPGPQEPITDSDESHFMRLPPELRLIIYENVLADFKLTTKHNSQPSLLVTCKLIRKEALSSYSARLWDAADEFDARREQEWSALGKAFEVPSNKHRAGLIAAWRKHAQEQAEMRERYHDLTEGVETAGAWFHEEITLVQTELKEGFVVGGTAL